MRIFLRYPRFFGDLFILTAVITSNAGSAWAGMVYRSMRLAPPYSNSAPPGVGFQIMMWTVYPLTLALLVLGVYLRSTYKRLWTDSPGQKE